MRQREAELAAYAANQALEADIRERAFFNRRLKAERFMRQREAELAAFEANAALEADIRERAFFNRRLKAERFMRQREAELAAFEANQARLKAEQERKRAEEERLKASEAQEKAGAPVTAAPAVLSGAPQVSTDPAAIGATIASPPLPPPKPKADQADPTASGLYLGALSRTKTRIADERLASAREASISAMSALGDCERSAASAFNLRQNASSRETLVRWPEIVSDRLTTLARGARAPGLEIIRSRPNRRADGRRGGARRVRAPLALSARPSWARRKRPDWPPPRPRLAGGPCVCERVGG
jgi:hypothetical protein